MNFVKSRAFVWCLYERIRACDITVAGIVLIVMELMKCVQTELYAILSAINLQEISSVGAVHILSNQHSDSLFHIQ